VDKYDKEANPDLMRLTLDLLHLAIANVKVENGGFYLNEKGEISAGRQKAGSASLFF